MEINLSKLLCYRLFYVVKLNEQLIDKEMAQFNLSRTQWKVIARFNFLPTPCAQQQLLASMGIDRAHLARTLDQLEQQGFIGRERVATDKRAYNIFLTAQGKRLLKKIEQILQSESETIMGGMSQNERTTLRQLLNTIESNILVELGKDNK
jgi:MarR family transcriptional regulator for hemolysin